MIYAGIDGGGSTTDLLFSTAPDGPRQSLTGPAINPQRVGLDQCVATLTQMLHEARGGAGATEPIRVHAGLAGAGRVEEQRYISSTLESALGGDVRVVVTHDAEIALDGAFGGEDGTIVISGTGSVVLARDADGQRLQVGGWGYLLGDEGSGTALGLEAIRAVCRALDGGPHTTLVQRARDEHGLEGRDHLIAALYREQWPAQRAARTVLQAAADGDAVAADILREQTHKLAEQVAWLARRAPQLPPRYVLMGGLANHELFRSTFAQALASFLPTWTSVTPVYSPTEAALRHAFGMQ